MNKIFHIDLLLATLSFLQNVVDIRDLTPIDDYY